MKPPAEFRPDFARRALRLRERFPDPVAQAEARHSLHWLLRDLLSKPTAELERIASGGAEVVELEQRRAR